MILSSRRSLLAHIIVATLAIPSFSTLAKAGNITLAAAASLKDALEEIKPELEKALPGTTLAITTGASGTLSQQILQGAPIDVFLSAASKPMEALAKEKALAEDTRRFLLTNEIVLVVPQKNPADIKSFEDLKEARVKRIAMGEPRSVPAGDYASQVLKKKNLENALAPKLILAKDVRQVLAYVERGEADAGFVYASDLLAKNAGAVKTVATAPKDSHEAIVYEIAVVAKEKSKADAKRFEEAKKVLEYLAGKNSGKTWVKYGFTLPGAKTALDKHQGPARAAL